MRTIDAEALMPLFMKKANTMKDRHGVKLGEEWLLNYNDIKDVIDNAPTVDTTCPNCDSGYAQGYSDGYLKGKEERPTEDLSEYSDKLWKKAYERGKAERPQGEWIADEFGRKICGKCQFPFAEFQSGNYCSLCGADMRGGRE